MYKDKVVFHVNSGNSNNLNLINGEIKLFDLDTEGVPYKVIGRFLSLPSFVIVAAFSGLSYAKSGNYQFNELGKVLKQDLILGGWVGTIIGLVIAFGGVDKSISNPFGNLFNAISACMIPLLYGYMIGNIIESVGQKDSISILCVFL